MLYAYRRVCLGVGVYIRYVIYIYIWHILGDASVNIMLRRLEIALKPDGWRGNVEDVVGEEMREEDARAQALKAVAYIQEPSREFVLDTVKGGKEDDQSAGGSVKGAEGQQNTYQTQLQQLLQETEEEEKSVKSMPLSIASPDEMMGSGGPGMGLDQTESFISAITHK